MLTTLRPNPSVSICVLCMHHCEVLVVLESPTSLRQANLAVTAFMCWNDVACDMVPSIDPVHYSLIRQTLFRRQWPTIHIFTGSHSLTAFSDAPFPPLGIGSWGWRLALGPGPPGSIPGLMELILPFHYCVCRTCGWCGRRPFFIVRVTHRHSLRPAER